MDEIFKFVKGHRSEGIRVEFRIPELWPDGEEIICRVKSTKRMICRDFIITPVSFPYISEILEKAFDEIIHNTFVDDLRRFTEGANKE